MLSIGICDDSQDNRQSLRWLLESILEEKNIEHAIFEFSSGETLLQWDQKHPNEIDLLFLDIEMGSVNGMETASQLREKHSALQIVFVTGFSDYVFDGYRVGALGYLMKPAKRDQLEEILSRFLVKLCQDAQEVYSCRDGDSWFRIPHKEILYFESDRRKVNCVTQNRTYSFMASSMRLLRSWKERDLSASISAIWCVPLQFGSCAAARYRWATPLCPSAAATMHPHCLR